MGIRHDGSTHDPYERERYAAFFREVLDGRPERGIFTTEELKRRGWLFGQADIEPLVRAMNKIDTVGKRNNTPVIFVTLPNYIPADLGTSHHRAFSQALAETGHLNVVDHRNKSLPAEYFNDTQHPNNLYFKHLLKSLSLLP